MHTETGRMSSFISGLDKLPAQSWRRRQSQPSHLTLEEMMTSMKSRCENEKKEAIATVTRILQRKHQREITTYLKRKEDEMARIVQEETRHRREIERKFLELKKEQEGQKTGAKSASALLKVRQTRRMEKMMEQNKKLEEALQASVEDERHNSLEIKQLKENYESQIRTLKKNWEKEVRKLTNDSEEKERMRRREDKNSQIVVNSGNYMIQFPKEQQEKKKNRRTEFTRSLHTEEEVEKDKQTDRELDLQVQLEKLRQEHSDMKEKLVAKLNASQQIVAPLKMKNRQFLARNLELSARNKQLESGRRNVSNSVSVSNSGPRERDRNKILQKQKLESRINKREDYERLSSADYEVLYSHLLREYRELCRAHQLLQARCGKHQLQDVEREEKQLHYYQVKLEAAETKLRDLENYFNNADRSDLIKNLIDEKESQTLKIFHLSEKIKVINEREQTLKSEVQEAKDQAELLEFRVLELEECQEKIKTSRPDGKLSQDIGTETDSDLIDSGRSSLRHSRSSSVTNDWEETQNLKPDFGNEKIYETQQKLHGLMSEVQGTSSKSLLIQTVALFEALLARIKDLQAENEKFKLMKLSDDDNKDAIRKASDEMVLEIEHLNAEKITLNSKNEETRNQVRVLEEELERMSQQLRVTTSDLSKREQTQRKLTDMQLKVEEDLKREVNSLSQKLNSTILGYRSESEMYEQSLLKVSILERSVTSQQQSITELQSENNQLRDQLSAALEHHTNKSSGSYGSDFGVNKSGSFSHPDMSDATTQDSTSSGVWSVTSDMSDSEEQYKSLSTVKESAIAIDCASFVDVQSYIDSLRSEQSELNKKLQKAEAEIKLLQSERSGGPDDEGWRGERRESSEQENSNNRLKETDRSDHENKFSNLLFEYNLLLTACYISSALNHANPALAWTVESRTETEERENLHQEIEQLRHAQHQLETAKEKLVDDTTREMMILEEKVTQLQREGEFMKDQYDTEKFLLEKELSETRSRDQNNSAHANHLQNIISEIEQEFVNIDCITTKERSLPDKIRYLIDNETKYLEEISNHKEKEQAFRETLAEADIIMTNIENDYKTKVAELEDHSKLLQQKLSLRSETERFVAELQQSDPSDEHKILLEKLFQKEKSEMNLMEKIFDLEKTVKEISQKVCDEKILKNELDNTNKDQELNIQQIKNLENENKELLEEVMKNKEVEFKYQELQQSEGFLRARIEELEIAEICQREESAECERRSGVRERKLQEEINKLRDEIKHLNSSASNYDSNCGRETGCEEKLKMEYEAVKERLRDVTCHLQEKCNIFKETESSLRAELSKARTSLTNTQRQLYEYDAENYQLKEKSLSLETKLAERHEEVDQLTNQLEKNNIEHSALLVERDQQIARMAAMTAGSADSSRVELPEFCQREGGLQSVVSDIQSLSTSLLSCHSCRTETNSTRLAEAASQLQFLTRVIYNDGPHDIYRCPSDDNILGIEVEEKLSPEEALLETQLTELTSKLDRMESEMCLVSEESKNLQQALEIKDSVILDQRQQLSELSQLVLTLERLVPSHQSGSKGRETRNGLSKLKRLQEGARTDDSIAKSKVNLTLLPPEHPQLLRRVGGDGLLVSWTPPEDDEVTGYLIYVNSELIQKVRSASRTKALLHNLDLGTSLTISLHSTSSNDEVSQEVTVEYVKDMELLVTSKKVSVSEQNNNQT